MTAPERTVTAEPSEVCEVTMHMLTAPLDSFAQFEKGDVMSITVAANRFVVPNDAVVVQCETRDGDEPVKPAFLLRVLSVEEEPYLQSDNWVRAVRVSVEAQVNVW